MVILLNNACSSSAEKYYESGNIYYARGDTENAIKSYTKAIELNPSHVNFYEARCKSYFETGDYAAYNSDLERITDLGSDMDFVRAIDNIYVHGKVRDHFSSDEIINPVIEVDIYINGYWKSYIKVNLLSTEEYQLYLAFNFKYRINYLNENYISKHIIIDARNIPEFIFTQGGYDMNVDMSLFEDFDGFDKSILKRPLGKAAFDRSDSLMKWDREYTDNMREKMIESLESKD
jgi:tetratricopeptide (TPR) repeat protein